MEEEKYIMTDEPCETIDIKKLPKLDDKTKSSVRTEFITGLSLSIVYFIFILSVPALNWFKPDWAFARMLGGMSYSWFLTTIVAMAMAFIIAYLHTKLYERWEMKSLQAKLKEKKEKSIQVSPVLKKEEVVSEQVSKEESVL
ncbi:hypothetical protein [Sporosarcina pasteurii]|uniref:DUF485 domain-containing protein n=1 Tax=Sporosarcina pasteurii TaxID=1474 RepID=A0A380CHE5_SPOPA|nr:hypothetical protein [Sporosarcina pasteurii]MDS9473178.1 hypothetical protein [Sporosarcina pasteurii]SUJ19651.1 Uncharacterised protein [Sporosarcina pasteurii]